MCWVGSVQSKLRPLHEDMGTLAWSLTSSETLEGVIELTYSASLFEKSYGVKREMYVTMFEVCVPNTFQLEVSYLDY